MPISFGIFVSLDMFISPAMALLLLIWNAVLYAFTNSDSVVTQLHSHR